MDPQEVGKLLFAPLIRRQADRRVVELALGTLQLHIVHGEKCDGRMEGCAFVTVHKGMILGEMESVGSRDVEQIDSGPVQVSVFRCARADSSKPSSPTPGGPPKSKIC